MRLLIDTDPGIDDALALLLALASPEVTVAAITTAAGNVLLDHATTNTLRVLAVACSGAPPRVARGASGPRERPLVTASHVHGDDGLGNIDRLVNPDGRPRYPKADVTLEMRDGPDLILELAGQFGEDLVIVALGPLTNLAQAIARDPRTLARAGRIVVMGGAIAVPGNVTPAAEFNFYVDPEAAAAVFDAGLPIELVPLDVTSRVVLTEAALARRLAESDGPVSRFVADVSRHGFTTDDEHPGIPLHDPLAVGVALDPSLVGFEAFHIEIECEGRATRGLSLADRRALPARRKRRPNSRVAMTVDAARFLRFFLDRLCRGSR